jgi:hypothetical protein
MATATPSRQMTAPTSHHSNGFGPVAAAGSDVSDACGSAVGCAPAPALVGAGVWVVPPVAPDWPPDDFDPFDPLDSSGFTVVSGGST